MNQLVMVTAFGQIKINLHEQQAPVTCGYFRRWAQQVGASFSVFRIVAPANHKEDDPCPISVVQVGDRGMGEDQCRSASGYPAKHENTQLTGLTHCKWTVSAARINPNELIGSFFICMRDEPELDYGGLRNPDGQGFAAFGEVVSGFEIAEKLFGAATHSEWLKEEIPVTTIKLVATSETD